MAGQVRLIDADGNMVGIVDLKTALDKAEEEDLDLIEISPNANPPVCKIADFNKLRYEEEKRKKENKKNQKAIETKEIRLSIRVEDHDLGVKAKNAIKFLEQGNKVKAVVKFRGREMDYIDQGKKVMKTFIDRLTDYGTVEKAEKMEGRNLIAIISPKKGKK